MQRFLSILLFMMFSLCFAAEAVKVSMIVGTTKIIQVPFVIESYKLIPAKTDIVRVEASDSQLRLMAGAIGEVNLMVSGGGMQSDYIISVKSNLGKVLKKLRSDLDMLTELDISTNEDQIVIKGTVTNPEHWNHLMRVLPNYSGSCRNFATFAPSAETVLNLKKMLTEAGFKFCKQGKQPEVGELSLQISSNNVILTGEMYSQKK